MARRRRRNCARSRYAFFSTIYGNYSKNRESLSRDFVIHWPSGIARTKGQRAVAGIQGKKRRGKSENGSRITETDVSALPDTDNYG